MKYWLITIASVTFLFCLYFAIVYIVNPDNAIIPSDKERLGKYIEQYCSVSAYQKEESCQIWKRKFSPKYVCPKERCDSLRKQYDAL